MSTFKNKNSLRAIEAQIVQKLKNNEARPKFTGSYKKACKSNINESLTCCQGRLTKLFAYEINRALL